MNFGPCCIPNCPDAMADTAQWAGHLLCYPHGGELDLELASVRNEWPEIEARINAWVAEQVEKAGPQVERLKKAGGYR